MSLDVANFSKARAPLAANLQVLFLLRLAVTLKIIDRFHGSTGIYPQTMLSYLKILCISQFTDCLYFCNIPMNISVFQVSCKRPNHLQICRILGPLEKHILFVYVTLYKRGFNRLFDRRFDTIDTFTT